MNIDFVRGITAHLTAAIVILIGLSALVWLTANGTVPSDVGVPAIVGIVTGAAGFLFGAEVSKQAAKQARSDLLAQPPEPPPAP